MLYKIKRRVRKISKTNFLFSNLYRLAGYYRYNLEKNIPHDVFLKRKYFENTGKILNLQSPTTYNEKLQWQKLYDHNPLYTMLVDKYAVREFVEKKIGTEYLVNLYGVYNHFNEIDFKSLPERFVLKCTHDCGSIIVCTDKSKLNVKRARKRLKTAMERNYFYYSREWPYKNVSPKIVCEEYLIDNDSDELRDYKIFCFNGRPKLIQVHFDRFSSHKTNTYSTEWKLLDVSFSNYPSDPEANIPRPEKLNLMLQLASRLSEGLPQARVDFYYVNNQIYFGEITFFHAGGMAPFVPESFNEDLGKLIDLSLVKQ